VIAEVIAKAIAEVIAEVIDKAVGLLAGRRRLVVRTEGGKTSFYTTS
jgi:hypothetical protein